MRPSSIGAKTVLPESNEGKKKVDKSRYWDILLGNRLGLFKNVIIVKNRNRQGDCS